MTLRQIRAAHADLFYPQEWFDGEAFMDVEADPAATMPHRVVPASAAGYMGWPSAATLARLYVANPTDPIWRHYLWTIDQDALGQTVYVGDNGKGLEIHRHLHLTERWGVPCWE